MSEGAILLADWNTIISAEVTIAVSNASNGIVLKAYKGSSSGRDGQTMAMLGTRIAADAGDIGTEVMALLAEIKLGK